MSSLGRVLSCNEIEVAVHRDVILAVKSSGDAQRLGFCLALLIGMSLLVDEIPVLGCDILVGFAGQAVHVVLECFVVGFSQEKVHVVKDALG